LKELSSNRLLYCNKFGAQWSWENEAVIKSTIKCDSILSLLSSKLQRLPLLTQRLLRIAACFGSTFDLKLVQVVLGRDVHLDLQQAECQDLILVVSTRKQFAHNQIQLCAYSQISEEEREATHLMIGRILWMNLEKEDLDCYTMDVVNQLCLRAHLIEDQVEKGQFCYPYAISWQEGCSFFCLYGGCIGLLTWD
jgi:predicted ATPase